VRHYEPSSPPPPSADPDRIKAVHWNIEHGNWYDQVECALRTNEELRDGDLFLFNEIDFGMARAGNRDVTGDLASALGLYGVWAPLFLETTAGRDDDARMAGGRANQEALFGIGLLSRWPIVELRIVELPSPEAISVRSRAHARPPHRADRHARPTAGALRRRVAHLEVHRTRAQRAAQMRALLAGSRTNGGRCSSPATSTRTRSIAAGRGIPCSARGC
jgi:endonuclease/exonuclease/phosphatase family metal-dependent hydrolase